MTLPTCKRITISAVHESKLPYVYQCFHYPASALEILAGHLNQVWEASRWCEINLQTGGHFCP